ncbi:TonB-dependent receptor [Pelomonas sp. Root1217]|uniref:TonB-dependent receptor n=1 Tax=Pelomonas sp. Root1217 TaxID=1736430 RepID=UPI00071086A3|nr:TonB-dependent receptor [Pelomonas sp. Root1217]KQV59566.1 TonB-dependent receptor [Pelomonas sp. Root1217]
MNQPRRTAISLAAAQTALLCSGMAFAQTPPAPAAAASAPKIEKAETVIVTGQRAALQSAQKIKQNSDEIVDSIVADDIGKLPDKSVTEVLQRIPGVTIDRTLNRADPQQGVGDGIQHFAAEGTGVSIRGLSYVRSELNGRDSFSANGGRALSFEDVPPELMAGVDVYKNPSAEQIEGAIGGLVNLRTALPFDYKGAKAAFSLETSRSQLRGGKAKPSFSGLLSNRWDTDLGQVGALIDVAQSEIATHSDGLSVSPYFPRRNAVVGDTSGELRWITPGGSWTGNDFERKRQGLYGALQWRKDAVSSSLTYFKSKYKMHTSENAFFLGTNPNTLTVDAGATFDAQGALLKGVLRAPTEGAPAPDPSGAKGIGFGTDARDSGRTAQTRDIAWHLSWKAADNVTLTSDLQHIKATTDGFDYTVGMGGYMPKQTVDLSTSPPSFIFDAADRAYLADPSHYYWGFAQEHRDHSVGTEKAWRGDVRYDFDHPVLRDLRFGLRLTERKGITQSTHDSEWAQISQGWAVGDSWQPLKQFAWLSDPRMAHDYNLHNFGSNFFNGKVPAPAPVIVPDMSLATGYPASFEKLHGYTQLVCKATCTWTPAPYGDDKGINEQAERTQAVYSQLRFGFDDLPYPVDGNVGLRVVRTSTTSLGYTLFTPPTDPRPDVPFIPQQSEKQAFWRAYTNILPSLNLRMKAGKELQFRFALSQGMTRPELWQMQAYTTLSQNVNTHTENGQQVLDSVTYTGSARGNPGLQPTLSNNVDLTAEYYFGRASSLTVAVFNKQLRDVIIGKTSSYRLNDTKGQPHDFLITAPVNGAKGRSSGIEVGYQQYFDKLPGLLSGFGVSGNYTYIDSRMTMYSPISAQWCTPSGTVDANLIRDLNGCDTDGRVLGGVPLTGLSKNSFNLALLYDYGPLSARVAYSWRSKYLQAVNAYGTAGNDGIDQNPASPNKGNSYSVNYALPTWGGSYGQLDMGVHYKFSDNLSLAVEGQNLNDAIYRQYMQQAIGLKERAAFASGRRYTLQVRYTY